jgi:uncharacterized membrane protein YuzA (DUF378 family)
MKTLHIVAFILLIIGGLNWLLVAFNWNLVEMIFGAWPSLVQIIYILVGVSAIIELVTHGKNCKTCGSMSK